MGGSLPVRFDGVWFRYARRAGCPGPQRAARAGVAPGSPWWRMPDLDLGVAHAYCCCLKFHP